MTAATAQRYSITRFYVNAKEDALQFDLAEGEQVVEIKFSHANRDEGEVYVVVTARPAS